MPKIFKRINSLFVKNNKLFSKNESLTFFIFKCVAGILSLAAISIRTHFIDPISFGNYSLITSSISLLISFFFTWIVESCGRFYEETDNKKMFFSTYLILFIVSFLLSVGGLFLVNFFTGKGLILKYFLYSLILLFTMGFADICYQIFRMSHQISAYCFLTLFSSLFNILVFILLPRSFGIVALFITTISINTFVAVVFFFYFRIHHLFSFKSFSFSLFKESIKYSLPLIAVWACIWIFNSSDIFVINFFYPESTGGEIGVYNLAHSLSNQTIGIITSSFTFAVFPKAITLWNQKKYGELNKTLSYQTDLLIKITLPAVIGLCMITPLLYSTMLSSKYNPNGIVQYLIICFGLTTLTNSISNIFSRVWQLENRTYLSMIFSVSSAILNIALDFLFVWLFGFVAAAVVSFSIITLRSIIICLIIRKKYKIHISTIPILKSTICSLGIIMIVLGVTHCFNNNLIALIISVVISILFYFGFMLFMGGFNKEKKLIKGI